MRQVETTIYIQLNSKIDLHTYKKKKYKKIWISHAKKYKLESQIFVLNSA